MNFLGFFWIKKINFSIKKINFFEFNKNASDVTQSGASNQSRSMIKGEMWRGATMGRPIARSNHDRRSLLKASGTWHDLIRRRIDLASAVDQRSYNSWDHNASKTSDQDPTAGVWCIIYKARDVASSRRSIEDPKVTT